MTTSLCALAVIIDPWWLWGAMLNVIAPQIALPRRADLLPRRLPLQERPPLELLEGLSELLLRVHHDRAVPRHRFLKRLSRDLQEPDCPTSAQMRPLSEVG